MVIVEGCIELSDESAMGIAATGMFIDPPGPALGVLLMFPAIGCIKGVACRPCPNEGLVTDIKIISIKKSTVLLLFIFLFTLNCYGYPGNFFRYYFLYQTKFELKNYPRGERSFLSGFIPSN